MHFGQTLRILRTTAGMTLRALARQLGLSAAYLSQVETGKLPAPKEEWIHRIEDVLGLRSGALMATADRLESEVTGYLHTTPEAHDFLHAARAAGLEGADFMELTAVLRSHGKRGLRERLRRWRVLPGAPGDGAARRRLDQLLREDLVFLLPSCADKESLFRELAGRTASRVAGLDGEELLEQLWQREEIASTGVGSGVAVPHATVAGLAGTVVALAVVRDGVDYGAVDGQPVSLCFMIVAAEADRDLHLGLLARIAQLCSHPDVRDGVLRARSGAQVVRFLERTARGIP